MTVDAFATAARVALAVAIFVAWCAVLELLGRWLADDPAAIWVWSAFVAVTVAAATATAVALAHRHDRGPR